MKEVGYRFLEEENDLNYGNLQNVPLLQPEACNSMFCDVLMSV